MSNLPSFQVGHLDVSGISAEDLQGSNRKSYINKPGQYDLEVVDFKLEAREMDKDHAGKQWGSANLTLKDVNSGAIMYEFVKVPLETAVYTAKSGKTSAGLTSRFCSFIESITGDRPSIDSLTSAIEQLPSILANGTFNARVGYKGDHVDYIGKNDQGNAIFTITLADGSRMLDSDGVAVEFSERDAAINYYQNTKGFKPDRGVSILGFNVKAR